MGQNMRAWFASLSESISEQTWMPPSYKTLHTPLGLTDTFDLGSSRSLRIVSHRSVQCLTCTVSHLYCVSPVMCLTCIAVLCLTCTVSHTYGISPVQCFTCTQCHTCSKCTLSHLHTISNLTCIVPHLYSFSCLVVLLFLVSQDEHVVRVIDADLDDIRRAGRAS